MWEYCRLGEDRHWFDPASHQSQSNGKNQGVRSSKCQYFPAQSDPPHVAWLDGSLPHAGDRKRFSGFSDRADLSLRIREQGMHGRYKSSHIRIVFRVLLRFCLWWIALAASNSQNSEKISCRTTTSQWTTSFSRVHSFAVVGLLASRNE